MTWYCSASRHLLPFATFKDSSTVQGMSDILLKNFMMIKKTNNNRCVPANDKSLTFWWQLLKNPCRVYDCMVVTCAGKFKKEQHVPKFGSCQLDALPIVLWSFSIQVLLPNCNLANLDSWWLQIIVLSKSAEIPAQTWGKLLPKRYN